MGTIILVKKRMKGGRVPLDGGDKLELEKNDVVLKDYTAPDLPYQSSTMNIGGSTHLAQIDIDDLTNAQLRAILNDDDVQVMKPFKEEEE